LERNADEVERSPSQAAWTCPTCGSVATTRYCGNCGERRPDRDRRAPAEEPRRAFIARVRTTLVALVSPPGRLTADWLHGRRVPYLAPLSIFLWSNVVFFLIQSITRLGILTWPLRAHLSDDSIRWLTTRILAAQRPDLVASASTQAYAPIFDALESVHAKSLVIVMIPAFAALTGIVLIDQQHHWRRALTFATHFFAFALLWLSLLFSALAVGLSLTLRRDLTPVTHSVDLAVTGVEAAVMGWYLYVALGTVFALSRSRRVLTVILLIAALYVILKAYHVVVFAVTLYST
jgi:Protein of unknown function (DUF3667)